MTTGVRTFGSYSAPGPYARKSWTGANGRPNWNTYTLDFKESFQKGADVSPSNVFIPNFGFAYTWSSNDELALLAKVSASVRGHSFNLAVATAEGGEAVRMLVDTTSRFAKSIWAIRKGNFSKAARYLGVSAGHRRRPKPLTLNDVSGQWLELQYGWKPLLADTYEASVAFSALANKARSTTYKASHRVKYNWDATGFECKLSNREVWEKVVRIRMVERLSQARSLGLLDPRPVVWEVLPFSFVADWFIPIGTYFDALAQIPNVDATFYVSLRKEKTGDATFYANGGYLDNLYWRGAYTKHHSLQYDRYAPSTSLSVPKPEFKALPSALSPGHLWNAIALLQQAVSSPHGLHR